MMNNVPRKRKSSELLTENSKSKKVEISKKNWNVEALNDDVLLHVFSYLNLGDVLNAAASSLRFQQVAEDYYRRIKYLEWKYCRLKVSEARIIPENAIISPERIFTRIGEYLTEILIKNLSSSQSSFNDFTEAFRKNCPNLRRITLKGCIIDRLWVQCLGSFTHLESLCFSSCIFCYGTLLGLDTLNEFHLCDCSHLHRNFLRSVLQRNYNIQKLTFESPLLTLQPHIFNVAPILKMCHLKSLSLDIYPNTVDQLNFLLQLNELTMLKLTFKDKCAGLNINGFLMQLAEKGILEELRVSHLFITEETFAALTLMKLKVLVIDRPQIIDMQINVKYMYTRLLCMSDLRHLTLALCHTQYDIATEELIAMIESLKYLEYLNLFDVWYPDCNFDLLSITEKINNVLKKDNRPKLNLTLPSALTAELLDKNGQIRSKYRFAALSKFVRFTKPFKQNVTSVSITRS